MTKVAVTHAESSPVLAAIAVDIAEDREACPLMKVKLQHSVIKRDWASLGTSHRVDSTAQSTTGRADPSSAN